MIDHLQVIVLSFPMKVIGLVLFTVGIAVIDPSIGAIGMAVLSASLAFLATWYWFQKNTAVKERDRIAAEHRKLVERVEAIELQSHVLAQAMLPISAAFQAILVKELTHMHTPEMDALMVKLGPPFILTESEIDRLASLLDARTRDMGNQITPSERDAAMMMPALMRRVRQEAAEVQQKNVDQIQLLILTAVVQDGSGNRKAMLFTTETSGFSRFASPEGAALRDHDQWERQEREVLTAAIAENTRITRETNVMAKQTLNSVKEK